MTATLNPAPAEGHATDAPAPPEGRPVPNAPRPAPTPDGRPRPGALGRLGRGRGPVRLRRPSTPLLLRFGMVLACVPVAVFAASVQLGVARNDDTLRTVARDATQGITIAQDIKLNLAELDELVVRDLLHPVALGTSGFPVDYDQKRTELHDNLVEAAVESSSGAAYLRPLANIDYALGHYHSLVKDAFAADARGDRAAAIDLYARANAVMEGTLLTEADFVDKANTYVLNTSYDRQKARSASTLQLILVTWLALLAATVVAVLVGAFAINRLDVSAADLTVAREQAFDKVHVLARARSTVVSARQAQGHLLLDTGRRREIEERFTAYSEHLFRVQGRSTVAGLAQITQGGDVPDGAGGLLAQAAMAGAGGRDQAARRTVVGLSDFLAADSDLRQLVDSGQPAAADNLYRRGMAFSQLTSAIDEAQLQDQATFDRRAHDALVGTARLDQVNIAAAGAVLLLVALGLFIRLREYGA